MGSLEEILEVALPGVSIPSATCLRAFVDKDIVMLWLPFLSNFKTTTVEEHRERFAPVCLFLSVNDVQFTFNMQVIFYYLIWYYYFLIVYI